MEPLRARPFKTVSIVNRLTLWFAFSLFLIVAVATGYLFWSNQRAMTSEEDSIVRDRLQAVEALLQGGDPLGAVRRRIETEWASRHFERLYVRVSDPASGVEIESPGMSSDQVLGKSIPGRVARVTNPAGHVFLMAQRTVTSTAVDKSRTFVVEVALDLENEQRITSQYRVNLFAVLFLSLIVAVLIGRSLAIAGFRPVHRIIQTARRVGSSNLHERIPDEGLPVELRLLAETVNQMLERLQEAFERLSRFSSDIAHELRTPVANIRGEMEVALNRSRSAAEYRQALESSLEETDRLSKIIDMLLFLAKAENAGTQLKKEPVDVNSEMQKIVEFYEAMAAELGVELSLSVSEDLKIAVERTLFQRAVANLLSNSLNHTQAGGKVEVQGTRSNGRIVISIRDTGAGIPERDLPRVFDRFYRADEARSTTKLGGFGLGLTIVKSIVQLHGGEISIQSSEGRGTTVQMKFPGL